MIFQEIKIVKLHPHQKFLKTVKTRFQSVITIFLEMSDTECFLLSE